MSDDFIFQETTGDDESLSFEDIEAAYLKALEVAEAAEASVFELESAGDGHGEAADGEAPVAEPVESRPEFAAVEAPAEEEPTERLSKEQVLEALLFVGGQPLSGKKLADVLGCDTALQVEELIDGLSLRYEREGRPYQIHLVEGGYEITLLPEFESVRSRVFGQGPKDVKLSQDVLEVLAFVAYQQPVTLADLNATEKKNAGGLLRQLLRRELVELHRGDAPGEETYRTTPRFLQLFGLSSLDDLPLAVDFDFK